MEWFKMQAIWGASVERLSDAEAGRFIKALFAYVRRGEEYHGGGKEEPTTVQALETLKSDRERLEKIKLQEEQKRLERSEKRRAAALKRWGKAENEASNGMQADASACTSMQADASACTSVQMDAICTEKQNQRENKNPEEPLYNNYNNYHSAGARGNPFAVSDEEVAEALERDRQIEETARRWGLPWNEGSMIQARDMARDFTLDWLLRAMETAGNGKEQTWRYVAGILRSWKQNGGPDAPKKPRASPGKTVSAQQYEQRAYTEAELGAVDGSLIEEALRMREADG